MSVIFRKALSETDEEKVLKELQSDSKTMLITLAKAIPGGEKVLSEIMPYLSSTSTSRSSSSSQKHRNVNIEAVVKELESIHLLPGMKKPGVILHEIARALRGLPRHERRRLLRELLVMGRAVLPYRKLEGYMLKFEQLENTVKSVLSKLPQNERVFYMDILNKLALLKRQYRSKKELLQELEKILSEESRKIVLNTDELIRSIEQNLEAEGLPKNKISQIIQEIKTIVFGGKEYIIIHSPEELQQILQKIGQIYKKHGIKNAEELTKIKPVLVETYVVPVYETAYEIARETLEREHLPTRYAKEIAQKVQQELGNEAPLDVVIQKTYQELTNIAKTVIRMAPEFRKLSGENLYSLIKKIKSMIPKKDKVLAKALARVERYVNSWDILTYVYSKAWFIWKNLENLQLPPKVYETLRRAVEEVSSGKNLADVYYDTLLITLPIFDNIIYLNTKGRSDMYGPWIPIAYLGTGGWFEEEDATNIAVLLYCMFRPVRVSLKEVKTIGEAVVKKKKFGRKDKWLFFEGAGGFVPHWLWSLSSMYSKRLNQLNQLINELREKISSELSKIIKPIFKRSEATITIF